MEVYRDDDFQQHSGPDLISDNPPTTTFKVLKTDSLEAFKVDLAEALVRVLAVCGVCRDVVVFGGVVMFGGVATFQGMCM